MPVIIVIAPPSYHCFRPCDRRWLPHPKYNAASTRQGRLDVYFTQLVSCAPSCCFSVSTPLLQWDGRLGSLVKDGQNVDVLLPSLCQSANADMHEDGHRSLLIGHWSKLYHILRSPRFNCSRYVSSWFFKAVCSGVAYNKLATPSNFGTRMNYVCALSCSQNSKHAAPRILL